MKSVCAPGSFPLRRQRTVLSATSEPEGLGHVLCFVLYGSPHSDVVVQMGFEGTLLLVFIRKL